MSCSAQRQFEIGSFLCECIEGFIMNKKIFFFLVLSIPRFIRDKMFCSTLQKLCDKILKRLSCLTITYFIIQGGHKVKHQC